MTHYIDLAKKYFDDYISPQETLDEPNLIDKLILSYRKGMEERVISSRAQLLEKCDEIMKDGMRFFRTDLKYKLLIPIEHKYVDKDIYEDLPCVLQNYLNDTYDYIKKRIECYFDEESDDFLIIEITDFL